MTRKLADAAWPRRMIVDARRLTTTVALVLPIAATALPAQSWNGYRWGRTGPLTVDVGDDYDPSWTTYVTAAVRQWNVAVNLDFKTVAGLSPSDSCDAVYGTIQLCSADYGRTGWVGHTDVATSGGYIVQATIRLNSFYFSQTRYDTAAWRAETICQELGNAVGLQDSDRNTRNANTGSCMDYTTDPSGTRGTNGSVANTAPSVSDLVNLDAIYALPGGRPPTATIRSTNTAVPEPDTWTLMIMGFGLIGMVVRGKYKYLTSETPMTGTAELSGQIPPYDLRSYNL